MSSIASFEDLLQDLDETLPEDAAKAPVDPTSPLEIEAIEEQSTLLEVDPAIIADARANQDLTYEEQAKQYPSLTVYLDTMYKAGVSIEEAGRLAEQHLERKKVALSPKEFVLKSILLVDDETINPETLRVVTNLEIWHKRIAARLEANDPSNFKWIAAGFGQASREFTIGILSNLFKRDQARSEDIANSLFLEPAEFDAFVEKELDDAEATGLFNIREYESLKDTLELVDNFGVDENAGFNQLLAILDISTLGATKFAGRVISKAGKSAVETVASKDVVKRVLAARSPSEVITAVKGDVAGARATVLQHTTGEAGPTVAGKAGPSTMDPTPNVNVPHAATVVEGTKISMLFEQMTKMMDSVVSGKAFSVEALTKATVEVADRLKSSSTNAFVKLSRRRSEGSDTFVYSAVLGKNADGVAFPTRQAALDAVDGDVRYEPIRRNSDELESDFGLNENKKGWYLRYEERIDTSRLALDIEDVTIEEGFVKRAAAKLFSAGQTTVGPRLGFMLNAAEGLISRVAKVADVPLKEIKSLSKAEFKRVNKVMEAYRDGPLGDTKLNLAVTRGAPSEGDFISDFAAVNGGLLPTEKEMKAYRALIDFNNSSWNVKATAILKEVIQRKGWSVTVEEGYDTIGVIAKAADDDVVFSRLQGPVRGINVGERVVYKLDTPFETADGKFYQFVTDVVDSRIPQKSDVLGYNFGGSRNNETLKFFIGTVFENTLEGGKKAVGGFRTLIGSFSAKDAAKAVDELNSIRLALAPAFKATGKKNIKDLELSGEELDKVNAVINANKSWNKSITDFASLKAMAASRGESFVDEFKVKHRDARVESEIVEGQGLTVGEYQSMRVAHKRGDTPLTEYGGGQVVNQDPIKNITEQFQSTAYRYTHYKATQAGINGWVQKAKRLKNVTFDGDVPSDPYDFIRLAKIKAVSSKTVEADMLDQQTVLKRRLHLHDATDRENVFYSYVAQQIYDDGVFGLGKGLKTKPEDWLDNTFGRARAFVFHLKMGMLNPDQAVLNASHVAQVISISPKAGLKASTAVPVIAQLMFKTRKAMLKDVDAMYANGFSGMTKQELLDTVQYMQESGRDIVGSSVLERSGSTFNNSQTVASELLEFGLTPFKIGELFGRIAAAGTAVVEYGAKKTGKGVFSDEGIQFVANREQVLSFRMTSGQKGGYQEGAIMSLATQWMSYTNRFADNVLIGRDLTKAERARMVTFNTILFGSRGMGFPPKWTAAAVALGIDPEDENSTAVLNGVKFGLFDLLLSQATGIDVSLGTRIAPLGGIVKQYQDLTSSDSVISALTGPSGQIGYDSYKALHTMIKVLAGGHTSIAAEELTVLMRNVKSVDIYHKVVDLLETGEYRSKRGNIAGTFSEEERTIGLAASVLAGATPMRVLNLYDAKDISYKEDSRFKDASKRINRWSNVAIALISTGDPAKMKEGNALYNDVMNLIEDGGFSQENQTKLYRTVVRMDTVVDLVKKATGQTTSSQITAKAATGE